jgi:uncharacterized membrane protein YciS (DUF1049 family)
MVSPQIITQVPKNPYAALLGWGLTIAVGVCTLVYLTHQIKLNRLQIDKHIKDHGDIEKK